MRRSTLMLAISLLLTSIGAFSAAQAPESSEVTPQDPPVALSEVTVSERRDRGYQALEATTATKGDWPVLETPVSIQVVPRAVMDDQQVIDLKEALKNVSGVQPAFGFGSLFNSFQLPGYVRVDAAAAYRWQIGRSRLTARLNIYNLFDQRYFESSNITDPFSRIPRLGIVPGAPLTVIGSVQVAYWYRDQHRPFPALPRHPQFGVASKVSWNRPFKQLDT